MQKEPNRFPRELLSQPWSARHAYFRDYCTVRHPKLMETFAELDHFVRRPSERRIFGLVGPTGAGKTKLKVMLVKAIIERLIPELTADPGRVPIATFNIWGPEVDAFSWRDFYHCYLESMDEVLITHKIARVRENLETNEKDADEAITAATKRPAPSYRLPTTHDLRRTVKDALRHRRPEVTIIDEGQHLMKMARDGLRLSQQFDVLKSLVDQTRVPHILIGPYELVKFLDIHGQLGRRSGYVHLPRYDAQDSKQLAQFQSVVAAFQRLLPLVEEPDLVKHYAFLYERSLGCVGILKSLLEDALFAVLDAGASRLSFAHLKKAGMPPAKCRQILREIREGEELVEEDPRDQARLLAELGITPDLQVAANTPPQTAAPAEEGLAMAQSSPPAPGGNPSRRRSPGDRNPVRDPVGLPAGM